MRAYPALEELRKANRVLADRFSDPENYLFAGVSNRHPGHVDCYTFNRFFKPQNFMKSANEDFVQILAFYILRPSDSPPEAPPTRTKKGAQEVRPL